MKKKVPWGVGDDSCHPYQLMCQIILTFSAEFEAAVGSVTLLLAISFISIEQVRNVPLYIVCTHLIPVTAS